MADKDDIVFRKFLSEDSDSFVAVRNQEYDDTDIAEGEHDYTYKRTRFVIGDSNFLDEPSVIVKDFNITARGTAEEKFKQYQDCVEAMEILKTAANAVIDNAAAHLAHFEMDANEDERQRLNELRNEEYDDDVPF